MRRVELEAAVRASIREAMEGGRAGTSAGLAAGLAIAAPVAAFFLHANDGSFALGLSLLGLVAFACTAWGTRRAIRAASTGKAIAWVIGSNVLPPTLVFAPTVIGLFFSVPSGLLAAIVVLPFVLAVRAWAAGDRLGREERESLLGAALLALVTVALVIAQAYERYDAYAWGSALTASLAYAPTLLTALASVALASWTFARDARRACLARRIERGEASGLKLAGGDAQLVHVERVADVGAGPLRSASTREELGDLPRSIRRIVAALVVGGAATLALAASAALMIR